MTQQKTASSSAVSTDENSQQSRRIPWWLLPEDDWRAVKDIAAQLGEIETAPIYQIGHVVRRCGVKFAEQVAQKALEVEANGGMMLRDGSRRRTPGGVFFELAFDTMTGRQRYLVMRDKMRVEEKRKRAEKKKSRTVS
jgi:hypothetical protein